MEIKTKTIIQLDKKVELYICHSWYIEGIRNTIKHGICGHVFEIIEYYYKLKNDIDCKILWVENLKWTDIEIAIKSKYDFDANEIKNIKENSIFIGSPKLITGSNILITDGGFNRLRNSTLMFDNIIGFACGERENHLITDPKITILQDESITQYGQVYASGPRTIDYRKKMLNRYKKIDPERCNLLYLTSNCRSMNIEDIQECINFYGKNEKWIIATNDESYFSLVSKNIKIQNLPIDNFHDKFDRYIYTPIDRKWDCSNRLIVECAVYNKTVEYYLPSDYLKSDLALLSRKNNLYDILEHDDDIINIIKDIL